MELHLGDCLEILKTIETGSIDLVLTDPPYGTTACKWDSVIPFEPMWKELKRIRKPSAAIVLFGSEPFSSHLRMSNIREFKYDWVWDKVNRYTGALNYKIMPLKRHELVSIFAKGSVTFNRQMIPGKPYRSVCSNGSNGEVFNGNGKPKRKIENLSGQRNPFSIISIPAKNNLEMGLHPTQKPVALLEYLIKTYTLEGETVLDFTMGSGSTGVACKNLKRRFIGIEKDPKYFEIAKSRIESAVAKPGANAEPLLDLADNQSATWLGGLPIAESEQAAESAASRAIALPVPCPNVDRMISSTEDSRVDMVDLPPELRDATVVAPPDEPPVAVHSNVGTSENRSGL